MDEIIVRQEGSGDAGAIDVVNRSAFGGEIEARLVDVLRQSPYFIPELSLVAEIEERLVGHVMLFRARLTRPEADTEVLALAPMSVVPSRSHRGIGSALVRAAVTKSASLGYGAIVVVGHPDYYRRFSFESLRGRNIACPLPVPEDMVSVLELVEGALEAGGALNYPPVFIDLFQRGSVPLAGYLE